MKFFVFSLLLKQLFCLIEIHRCFTDGLSNQKFSTDGGWYMRHKDPNKDSINDSKFISGTQYYGLSLMFDFDGLIKRIADIPPHSMLHVSSKLAVYGKKQFMIRSVFLKIDSNVVQTSQFHSQIDTNEFNPFLVEFSSFYVHTYKSAMIQFVSDANEDQGIITFGMRDFILSYVPCPVGCLICDVKDKTDLCSKWIIQYNTFERDLKFSNDGWTTNGKIQYYDCQGVNLGPFDSKVTLNRTLFLDPHYEMKIIFLFTQINVQEYLTNYQLEIDSVKILDFRYFRQMFFTDICNDLSKGKDLLQRIDKTLTHSNRITKISFFVVTNEPNNPQQFIIRDFQIYIKKCYSGPNVNCYQCSGPLLNNCKFDSQKMQFNYVTQNDFTAQSHWQVILPLQFSPMDCNNDYLLGLDPTLIKDYYFQKTFYDLPTHTSLNISFIYYQIDDFTNEQFDVILDGNVVYSQTLVTLNTPEGQQFCNIEIQFDKKSTIQLKLPHTDTVATVQIVSRQTQTTSTLGIMNFKLIADWLLVTSDLTSLSKSAYKYNYDGWIATKISDQLNLDSATCPGITLLGVLAPNQKIQRRLTIDQPNDCHSLIHIKYSVYIFSAILDNESVTLLMDGKPISKLILGNHSYEICSNQVGQIITGELYLEHSKHTAFFELTTTATIEKWGVSEFTLRRMIC